MSEGKIRDALSKPIDVDVPEETVRIAVEVGEDKGASIAFNKDFGKPGGWSGEAEVGWWQSMGASVKGVLSWKGKKR